MSVRFVLNLVREVHWVFLLSRSWKLISKWDIVQSFEPNQLLNTIHHVHMIGNYFYVQLIFTAISVVWFIIVYSIFIRISPILNEVELSQIRTIQIRTNHLELKTTPFAIKETGYAGFHLVKITDFDENIDVFIILAHWNLFPNEERTKKIPHRIRSWFTYQSRWSTIPTKRKFPPTLSLYFPRSWAGVSRTDSCRWRCKLISSFLFFQLHMRRHPRT